MDGSKANKPFGLNEATVVLQEGLDLLHPEAAIEDWWEVFTVHVHAFLGGEPSDLDTMIAWRLCLEQVRGDSYEAEQVVASMKLALDAYILVSSNPFTLILDRRPTFHNGIDPLVQKAVRVHTQARKGGDDFDTGISYDPDPERMAMEQNERFRMHSIIRNAIRPAGADE